ESGLLKLDRIMYSSFYKPCNYGFIPQTYGHDKDPLDILVITSLPVQPMCLMQAKVIGVMPMIDSGEADDKIIAVANTDPGVNHYNKIEELPRHFFEVLMILFLIYSKLDNQSDVVENYCTKYTTL